MGEQIYGQLASLFTAGVVMLKIFYSTVGVYIWFTDPSLTMENGIFPSPTSYKETSDTGIAIIVETYRDVGMRFQLSNR